MRNQDNLGSHVDTLERETAEQAAQIAELQKQISSTEAENILLRKVQGQISLVRLLFIGIFFYC